MGTSTDAKLAWGVDLGEKIPRWLYEEFGVAIGDDDFGVAIGDDVDGEGWGLEKALNAAGLSVAPHCSIDCTMYVLCVEASLTTAWCGHSQPIDTLDVSDEWRETWKRVARVGDPKWLLFSWWG